MDGYDVLRVPKSPSKWHFLSRSGNCPGLGDSSASDYQQLERIIWHLLGLDRFRSQQLGLSGTSTLLTLPSANQSQVAKISRICPLIHCNAVGRWFILREPTASPTHRPRRQLRGIPLSPTLVPRLSGDTCPGRKMKRHFFQSAQANTGQH